jgi:xanthine dehydrogenase YagR molybdenum-binding subunit
MKYIGKAMSRVDGVAKVTGKAKYAAEFQVKDVAYGYIVQSAIAKGTIKSIDVSEAEKQSGVIKIYTHLNTPKTQLKSSAFTALQSEKILFSGQPIALVVAETFEQARFASRLIKVTYAEEKAVTEECAVIRLKHSKMLRSKSRLNTQFRLSIIIRWSPTQLLPSGKAKN